MSVTRMQVEKFIIVANNVMKTPIVELRQTDTRKTSALLFINNFTLLFCMGKIQRFLGRRYIREAREALCIQERN